MYNLFLDDERVPKQVTWVRLPTYNNWDWVIVRDYDQFVKMIEQNGLPEFITFDHDLAAGHYVICHNAEDAHNLSQYGKTGYDCAKWLVEYCRERNLTLPQYQVHSMNPVGAQNIRNALSWR